MKNKYKVVALVPLEFSVEGSSDFKEAIECRKVSTRSVSRTLTL